MISRTELNERIREWGIREDVIEKDYVIGWVLWGIGADPALSAAWAFKGGTCLKKCYVETFRFSEDLDFTLLPGATFEIGQVIRHLKQALVHVYEESGIALLEREPVVRMRPDGRSAEGRVYYRGPRNTPGLASIRIDLTIAEKIVRPTFCARLPTRTRMSFRCQHTFDATASKRCSLRSYGLWERGLVHETFTTSSLFTEGHRLVQMQPLCRPSLERSVNPKVWRSSVASRSWHLRSWPS